MGKYFPLPTAIVRFGGAGVNCRALRVSNTARLLYFASLMTSLAFIPRNTFVGRLLRLPLRFIPRRQVMTVRSGLNVGCHWIAGSSTHGCWLGVYELDKQELVRQLVRPGMKVLDIGANAGFYTLAFARLVGASGHVWSFEPLASNVHHLLQHVELNDLHNVTIVQTAISDKSGLVGFQIHESNAMGAMSASSEAYCVPAVSLDDLLRNKWIEMPDLIKMDVEGAEALALSGASEILSKRECTWVISLHGAGPAKRCGEILRAAGYEIRLTNGELASEEITTDEIFAVPRGR
jgi:FkbM family methyltransferase